MLKLGLALSVGRKLFSDAIDALLSTLRGRATYYENGSASKSTIKAIDDADVLDKATILLTPTATSDALVHCVKDNTSDSDFDFDRASSATRINSSANIEDITSDLARISYDSNGDNGHILLEPTSTNLITYSEDFSAWTTNDVTLGDDVTSPDGTTNATTINVNDASALFYNNYTVVASTTYTFSFFVKRGTLDSSSFKLSIYDDSNNAFISENISYTTSTEWTRVDHTFTTPSGCTDVRLYTYRNTSGSTGTFFQWGVQLEALSYATSYIPTLTGSTVTRATETLLGSGNSTLINSTEGVLYAETAALANDLELQGISLSDGGLTNRVVIFKWSTSNGIRARVTSNGSNVFNSTTIVTDIKSFNKIALKYKENDFALWINGVEVLSAASGAIPIGLNTLDFTSSGVSGSPFYGKCKAVAVFNEALSDTELENLTS